MGPFNNELRTMNREQRAEGGEASASCYNRVMEIRIITSPIKLEEITRLAAQQFGVMIKAVVDLKKRIMALGGELHADEEQLLLNQGSDQADLWGVNLYPAKFGSEEFIQFDSMINIRPSAGNLSRNIEDEETRGQIGSVIADLVKDGA